MKPQFWAAQRQKPWLGGVLRTVEKPQHPLLMVSILMFLVFLLYINTLWHFLHGASSVFMAETKPIFSHPISGLIAAARDEFAALDTNHEMTVDEAAKLYREKRGRHPPPSFDKWVAFAASRGRSVSEAFFDQIYEDLEPFWGKQPEALRTFATTFSNSISVRDGEAKFRINPSSGYIHGMWIEKWIEALDEISADLPDMDLAMNEYDEARIIVPWEEMAIYMQEAAKSRHIRPPTSEAPVLDEYTKYPNITEYPNWKMGDEWDGNTQKWLRTRVACRPDSPVRNKELNETGYPHFADVKDHYVRNLTHSRHVCEQPDLYNFHSAFIRPLAPYTTTHLYPLFGACKIFGVSNDIVLPAAMYMMENDESNGGAVFTGGTEDQRHIPWKEKLSKAYWRGSDSGGLQDSNTWRYFQRTRLASMMNGTSVQAQEPYMHPARAGSHTASPPADEEEAAQVGAPFDFPWPHRSLAALGSKVSTFGRWVSSLCDSGIVNTDGCQMGSKCEWLWPYFAKSELVSMADNFRHKYLPDVDGFAYSGRYNAFLDSTSLPIKATIYAEWHHSRLVPWRHFVPMDNTMRDWWGILEYFAGFDAEAFGAEPSLHRDAHDEEAEMIALQGSEWSKQHLRRDDMIVYMFRLLLEYARVCDDRREDMGWTGDLM